MKVFILYHTKTGHTLEALNAVCEGLKEAGCRTEMVTAAQFDPLMLKECQAIIVGSPCWGGSYGNGLSKPVRLALEKIQDGALKGMRTAGISVNGSLGGDSTVKTISGILAKKGSASFMHGPVAKAGAPLSLWTGPAVKPEDLARYREFGRSFGATLNSQQS